MKATALTLALAATPAAVLAQPAADFCDRLQQVAASAGQTPAFGSFVNGQPLGGGNATWVPATMRTCVVTWFGTPAVGDQYDCVGHFGTEAAASAELARLQSDLAACLKTPGASSEPARTFGLGQLDYAAGPKVRVSAYRQSLRLGHRAAFTIKVLP